MNNPLIDNPQSTIFALATASGRGAVAIMRISGPLTKSILVSLCHKLPEPRQACVRKLRLKRLDSFEVLDHAMVLWLPGPNSYTGEDSAEFHLHAGPAVIDGVASALAYLGAKPAEAGEFTKRAFLNGRVDLLQAEGVADLVEAETQAQKKQALEQTEGGLSRIYEQWGQRLREILSYQEALIDFPDEELPEEMEVNLKKSIDALQQEMAEHLNDNNRGEKLRRGLIFVILGAPNAGKSTLLNVLSNKEAAIVTDQAGTTRDAIEVRLILGDAPVTLVDTAGLRETEDKIEKEGIRRAKKIARDADFIMCLTDASVAVEKPEFPCDLWIRTKNDLNVSHETISVNAQNQLYISTKTGENIKNLRDLLSSKVKELTACQGPPPLTRVRHRLGLLHCVEHLKRALVQEWPELRGEELRLAMQELGKITGKIAVEDLLDTIFSQFCIGK